MYSQTVFIRTTVTFEIIPPTKSKNYFEKNPLTKRIQENDKFWFPYFFLHHVIHNFLRTRIRDACKGLGGGVRRVHGRHAVTL